MVTALEMFSYVAQWARHRLTTVTAVPVIATMPATFARACDHLDSPATGANPQVDIGDVHAWMSPEGRRRNLSMTMQGHTTRA